MGFIGERVDARSIDPAIVEIEERANGDGVINHFVGPTGGLERLHVGSGDAGRVMVYLVHEAE